MGKFNLFSSESINKAVDAIVDTGDMLVYTDEEKADYNQKKRELKIEFAKSMAPYKVAQRAIAIASTMNFILAFWAGVGLYVWSTKEMFKDYISLVNTFQIGWIMMVIISFYFLDGSMSWFKKDKTKG